LVESVVEQYAVGLRGLPAVKQVVLVLVVIAVVVVAPFAVTRVIFVLVLMEAEELFAHHLKR
jgi:hypothetical protein